MWVVWPKTGDHVDFIWSAGRPSLPESNTNWTLHYEE